MKKSKVQKSNYNKIQVIYHGCIKLSRGKARGYFKARKKYFKSTYSISSYVNKETGVNTVNVQIPPKIVVCVMVIRGGKF
ncbi:MAG: hypothetical protein HRT57_03370 [Crocinitomicaceae bacterium]|nr:hypothetical protein [Crocinitomicaceae bacterium]